jgi:NAD(P)H-flavin reductase
MQAVTGSVPASAQPGLKNTLAAQNYFLACSFHPEEDLEIRLPMAELSKFPATVVEIDLLNSEIVRLKLALDNKPKYKAGQFINLYKDDTTSRSYSLASVPEIDDHLQFHIRKLPDGLVSHWIHHELKIGDNVEISDASGDCFYVPDLPDQNLLLIATGTGLAPLYGIVRDALKQGHTGAIKLYHGSNSAELVYLTEELNSLALKFDNFIYTPCISGKIVPQGFAAGRAQEVAFKENPDLSGWRVFLCGHPDMVSTGKKLAFLAGASSGNIYADPFVIVPRDTSPQSRPN